MVLVAFLKAAEYGYGACLVGLVDHHFLETAFEGLVLFKIFLILVEGGGTDAAELAAGQGRLKDVCGIHGALAFACTHKGVDFVDKEYYLTIGACHFVDNSL